MGIDVTCDPVDIHLLRNVFIIGTRFCLRLRPRVCLMIAQVLIFIYLLILAQNGTGSFIINVKHQKQQTIFLFLLMM